VATDYDRSIVANLPICGWLAQCSPQFRNEFLARARPKPVAAGNVIYRADEVGQDICGIRSGVVLVQTRFPHSDAMLLHMLRAGEWFGALARLNKDHRRVFTTIARTDVELLRVPFDELNDLLQRHPEGYAKFGLNAIHMLELATQCAGDLLIKDSAARCAAGLLRMAGRRWASDPEADLPSEIPASQVELAMQCNVSRKTFSRIVSEFSGAGLVTIGYKWLTVQDPARLRHVAEGG
jgi:CRP/FNR family transcriptional regulator